MPETSRCPVCRSSQVSFSFETADNELHHVPGRFDVWQCGDCVTFFLSPMPRDVSSFYPSEYAAYQLRDLPRIGVIRRALHELAGRDSAGMAALGEFLGTDNRLVDLVAHYRDRPAPRRVLDVGCGTGEFGLRVIEGLGLDRSTLLGIDLYEGVEEVGRKRGARFLRSSLPDLDEGVFDLVILSHVLEHAPEPRALLREVVARLAPGGALMLSVPSSTSLLARLLPEIWIAHSVPRHLYCFSARAIEILTADDFSIARRSTGDLYTFMLGRYIPGAGRYVEAVVRRVAPLLRAGLSSFGLADNLNFILERRR
jgi:2-polyprenyl-3-methyl-5-hydroxy-6-metoxy-1,4-benzoquinol methylase